MELMENDRRKKENKKKKANQTEKRNLFIWFVDLIIWFLFFENVSFSEISSFDFRF